MKTKEYNGWLFDLYAHPEKGVVAWLIGKDGRHHYFRQDFEIIFYAGGPFTRLRELWRFLRERSVKLARTQREDLFAGKQEVLEVRVPSPAAFPELFREVSEWFSDLTFYDVDIPLTLRYCAAQGVFPLARCRVTACPDGTLTDIIALGTPWDVNPEMPPLRKVCLRPDVDPGHAKPNFLLVDYQSYSFRLPLGRPRELLLFINNLLCRYNPDVLLTDYGDTWLFSYLEGLSERFGIPFNPNRDLARKVLRRKEISFHNYGQAHFRGEQVHLLGRWHIDRQNCMTFEDYGLTGAIEQARLTGLPIQEIARRSPGAGIAAMQTMTALRRRVLVPYQHQKGEVTKRYRQIFKADRGGLVCQPLPGIFANVAVLDFFSMYPVIICRFNLSPETVGVDDEDALEIPELGIRVGLKLGLVPETLRPLVEKRRAFKEMMKSLDKSDPLYQLYKTLAKALKWLLVVAYGRLGYANSTFGRINSHEAVTHMGRQALLQAKRIAEDHGFTILHMYVDSLFICRADAVQPEDFQPLLDEIERETDLPIELEEVYPWMAFTASRKKKKMTVANRFFGLQPDGEFKVRGLALRRRDTPAFVARTQVEILNILARQRDPSRLMELLPEILDLLREKLGILKNGEVALKDLLISQTLSRELDQYHVATPLAQAAMQLRDAGRTLHMGQQVRYIRVLGEMSAIAWDLPERLHPGKVDLAYYKKILFRGAYQVLQPLGIEEDVLRDRLFYGIRVLSFIGKTSAHSPWKIVNPWGTLPAPYIHSK